MMTEPILCKITAEAICEVEVFQFVKTPQHGGMNFFFGAVRDFNGGKNVVAVSYDAFEPLAEQVFRDIAREACQKWGNELRIYIVHRVGKLLCGDTSVGIGVSSRHRDESYQASRYVIENIKHRAPIWKKEFYENGETEWLKGHALCQRTHGASQTPELR
jgi:molybdopterin synthase catalytic subunit